jgi:hypothetical protein
MIAAKGLDSENELCLTAVKHRTCALSGLLPMHQPGLRAYTGLQTLKHKRYPVSGVRAMTIAAGFRCIDGIVIGADSQFEEGDAKYNGDKILHIPAPCNGELVITGAGDFDAIRHCAGFFKDRGLVSCGPRLVDLKGVISQFIAGNEYKNIIKDSKDTGNSFEMIIGVRSGSEQATDLLYVCQHKISSERRFKIVGSGSSISRFFSEFFWRHGITVDLLSPFVLSIVKAAKMNHAGVDGQTKVIGLSNVDRPGTWTYMPQDEFLWGTFAALQKSLLIAQNPTSTKPVFEQSLKDLLNLLNDRWVSSRSREDSLNPQSTTADQ